MPVCLYRNGQLKRKGVFKPLGISVMVLLHVRGEIPPKFRFIVQEKNTRGQTQKKQ